MRRLSEVIAAALSTALNSVCTLLSLVIFLSFLSSHRVLKKTVGSSHERPIDEIPFLLLSPLWSSQNAYVVNVESSALDLLSGSTDGGHGIIAGPCADVQDGEWKLRTSDHSSSCCSSCCSTPVTHTIIQNVGRRSMCYAQRWRVLYHNHGASMLTCHAGRCVPLYR